MSNQYKTSDIFWHTLAEARTIETVYECPELATAFRNHAWQMFYALNPAVDRRTIYQAKPAKREICVLGQS